MRAAWCGGGGVTLWRGGGWMGEEEPSIHLACLDNSIRHHMSAYASIRQHTSAYVSIRQHTSAYVSIRQHTSAYVSIRQHTSAIHLACLANRHHISKTDLGQEQRLSAVLPYSTRNSTRNLLL
jgi:hypothetical protein